MKRPIAVIADDLTGALDTASCFVGDGKKARVTIHPTNPWDQRWIGITQVYDAETRQADTVLVQHRVEEAVRLSLHELGKGTQIYIKLDSTLRGPIGTVLETCLRTSGKRFAFLAPSFPKTGRTVTEGRLHVHGLSVADTEFAHDVHWPIKTDSIIEIVRSSTDLPVAVLTLDVIREGLESIQGWLAGAFDPFAKHGIVICDSETQGDLAKLAVALCTRSDILPAGSAGLAGAWAEVMGFSESAKTRVVSPECSRVAVVVGSANPVTHRQLDHVLKVDRASVVDLAPAMFGQPGPDLGQRQLTVHLDSAARHTLDKATDSVLCLRLSRLPLAGDASEATIDPSILTDGLAQIAARWVESHSGESLGLVASGGDTVLSLCRVLAVSGLWPQGDIEPGMPLALVEWAQGTMPIVTKAGGFGNTDSLHQAVSFLTGGDNL